MTIKATIIADSVSPAGKRITTYQLRYPRFIHAEFMTHRVFSRNASSSRAIPVERMIEDLRREPAMPVYWGANQKGMQAAEELSEEAIEISEQHWLNAMELMIDKAQDLLQLGLHKQIANRILEPWAHINVVCTATEWNNFFMLRRHEDAQPEIKALADAMWEAQKLSVPHDLQIHEWHLPYIKIADYERFGVEPGILWQDEPIVLEKLRKVSVARCARVSYLTHDGRQTTIEEGLKLYERLVGSQPLHASPAEHQATPDDRYLSPTGHAMWRHEDKHGNFVGWLQLRKMLPGEYIAG